MPAVGFVTRPVSGAVWGLPLAPLAQLIAPCVASAACVWSGPSLSLQAIVRLLEPETTEVWESTTIQPRTRTVSVLLLGLEELPDDAPVRREVAVAQGRGAEADEADTGEAA